jgi:pyrroline-5-carboxylate reductase
MITLPDPAWMVGCGNMGGAVLDGWRAAGIDLAPLTVIRPSGRAVEGVRTVASPAEAGAAPRLVLLAMKPQKLDEVAPVLAPQLGSGTVLVSLLAGVEAASLRRRFPQAAAIVRAMPNLPVAVRRGVVALFSEDAEEAVRLNLSPLFSALGYALWTSAESQFAAIGSVAGAGPAYVARFVAALASAGEAGGMSEELAGTVALETVLGTAWLATRRARAAMSSRRADASPNGTTEAGLAMLDRDAALERLVGEAVAAARRRGAELAGEAR